MVGRGLGGLFTMLYPKFIKLSPLNGVSRAARWKITHP